ncbi:MAG: acetylxylan esterase [Gemmataceae bacterium]|jgi:dienelactone hydrolase|nr:acetylxylan esterase [Gemmataceae bacterium]
MRTLLFVLCLSSLTVLAEEPLNLKVYAPKETSDDPRFKIKTLNDYFPFIPPKDLKSWSSRAEFVRRQILVANGLWPLPEKGDLKAVIHGKIDREEYTIEKVYFASREGHYVTGNLYRPKGKSDQKRPAVLSPHGHWPPEGPKGGRFYENNEENAKKLMKAGDEKTLEGARYPLQARCATLARLGYVVFHFDMVGYADSQPYPHRKGFSDAQADLWLHNYMGIQTWNCIRAYDFLESLPDVDPKRIGVTGASGGGTQTFILGAIDPRPAVLFPAVMVSTAMQGGCVCENAPYLRVNTGNVEFAALAAPKPLGLSAANDWTKEIMTKGYPELQQLYKMYGDEKKVKAKAWLEFGHNYNQPAREMMYEWFNTHLLNQSGAVAEPPFKPVPPAELSVYDEKHPRPRDELSAERLRELLQEKDRQSFQKWTQGKPEEYRRIVGGALAVFLGADLPSRDRVENKSIGEKITFGDYTLRKHILSDPATASKVPAVSLQGKSFNGSMIIWVHPEGKQSLLDDKGQLNGDAKMILDKGYGIVAPDCFGVGESQGKNPFAIDKNFASYTLGYNLPILSQRVRDILTCVAFAQTLEKVQNVKILGLGSSGPWTILARAALGEKGPQLAADLNGFAFEKINSSADPMFLPGALKYGGLSGFLALCAPSEVFLTNGVVEKYVFAFYRTLGQESNLKVTEKGTSQDLIAWLTK